MSKFISYETSSGEIVFCKLSEISSFKPKYVDRNKYVVFATVAKEVFPVADFFGIEEAKKWIHSQIALIEKSNG